MEAFYLPWKELFPPVVAEESADLLFALFMGEYLIDRSLFLLVTVLLVLLGAPPFYSSLINLLRFSKKSFAFCELRSKWSLCLYFYPESLLTLFLLVDLSPNLS